MMTPVKLWQLGLLCWLAFSLCGCFKSNPPVHIERYSLPEVTATPPDTAQYNPLVLRIQLADYLDTDRIVIQTDDITMQPARDHLWVDNLSQQLYRGLRTRLARRLGNTIVVEPATSQTTANTLRLTIDQFHGQIQGYAVLSGQWQFNGTHHTTLASHAFRFSTALTENGYPALVRALGQTLDQLADAIAQQVRGPDPS